MQYRPLGRTGLSVSAVGFGAWAIGGSWGPVDDAESLKALHAAVDVGVDFIDTADVYGDGRSERLIGRLLRERPGERILVATKVGRRAPLDPRHYTPENLSRWIDRCRENLGVERLDLVQLHCPPTEVYHRQEVFAALDEQVAAGAIALYGVSVERVDEGLRAIEHPGVATVQIIYNAFRQRPAERFLGEAAGRGVGVIARVPLASGLLTGKLRSDSSFPPDDHRNFNRRGEAFDVGETFAGVDYDTALEVVEAMRPLVPRGWTMAQLALRWILMNEAVSTVIPGARTAAQARENAAAADLPEVPADVMERIAALYRERIAPQVHHRW